MVLLLIESKTMGSLANLSGMPVFENLAQDGFNGRHQEPLPSIWHDGGRMPVLIRDCLSCAATTLTNSVYRIDDSIENHSYLRGTSVAAAGTEIAGGVESCVLMRFVPPQAAQKRALSGSIPRSATAFFNRLPSSLTY
ncbi:hypothetical protein N9Z64_02460 [bacterium]|nr:hypothetical protein [bacterium]